MSDTPKTDAAIIIVADQYGGNRQLVVPAEFAAAQERQITQMQIEIDAITRQRDETYRQLTEARAQIQQLTFGSNR